MRVYFLSRVTAGLKLNGVYAGIIDTFEKFFDMDEGDEILCEVLPDSNFRPYNFFINEKFFKSPPDFADVYLSKGDAVISFNRYVQSDCGIKVISQLRCKSYLATLFSNGGAPCLIAEGKSTERCDLPREFLSATLSEGSIGGFPVLFVQGEGCLAVIDEGGKCVFMNPAKYWNAGEKLEICVPFPTCAGVEARCIFAYDGKEMRLESSRATETQTPDISCLHFAFFESVLTKANCSKYLCDELKGRVGELNSFLGDFTEVVTPPEKFYADYPDIHPPESNAAGLVYPISSNLFEIKYFAVQFKDGLIDNIFEPD